MSTKKPSENKKTIKSPFAKVLASILVGVISVNAVIAYVSYDIVILQKEKGRLAQLASKHVQGQTKIIQDYISDTTTRLQVFTRRNDVLQAINNGDSAKINRIVSEVRRQFKDVRGARIDAHNSIELDPDAEVPINFAEVDMVNRAGRRQAVYPEGVERNGEWRINFVQAIPYASKDAENPPAVAATLFVSLSAKEMLSRLGKLDLSQGNMLLLQQFNGGEPTPMVQVGQGGGGASQEAAIADSHWLLRFTPSQSFAEQAKVSATLLFVILSLIATISITGGIFGAKHINKVILSRQEEIAMAEQAVELTEAESKNLSDSSKLLELEVKVEDINILNLKAREEVDPLEISDQHQDSKPDPNDEMPLSIFRSYDIRGVVPSQLSPTNVVLIGKAIGSLALEAGEKNLIVGKDGRTHSNDVCEQLIEGIVSTGCNVINLGMVPTPLVYFAIAELESSNSGVSVTASHNSAEYNGFKVVLKGKTLADHEIHQIYSRIISQQFAKGAGKEDFTDLSFQYIDKITSDIALATDLKVVVDAGNGVAGDIAPRVFKEIGCEVIPLHCKVDGTFPNHEADPSLESNLRDLINKVKAERADIGIALDGDGDRLGVVTASGKIIWPDRLLMLLAKDILSRNPGTDVLYDVKCSRNLNSVINTYGGRPIMWKSGHSHMKTKMKEIGAILGGELSGHIFIGERWYGFDDGIYAAARVMEIMSMREQDLDSIFESFPVQPSTPELKLRITEQKKFSFMKRLIAEGVFNNGKVTTIDGLRVDFENGWGLVRASNTSPYLTLRFEADTEEALTKIKSQFKQQMHKVDPQLGIGF